METQMLIKTIRMSEDLINRVEKSASNIGIDFSEFIRVAIEEKNKNAHHRRFCF